jgi:hypothetical protein
MPNGYNTDRQTDKNTVQNPDKIIGQMKEKAKKIVFLKVVVSRDGYYFESVLSVYALMVFKVFQKL